MASVPAPPPPAASPTLRHSGEAGIRAHAYCCNTPRAVLRPVPHHTPHWVPACAGTTGWWCLVPAGNAARPTAAHRKPPLRHSGGAESRAHAYCCNTLRAVLHVRCLITPHWVPAFAGTTGWTAGASSPLPCRHDGLVRWCPHQRRSARPNATHRKYPFVIPAKAGIQNPRSPVQLTPRAPLHLRCPSHAALGTGLRWYDGLVRWCPHQRGQSPPPPAASPHLVIPAKAGIQGPRLLLQHRPSSAARPVPHLTPHWYRPAPVRRAGRLVPLRRCLAPPLHGDGLSAGAHSPLPCRACADDPVHSWPLPARPPPPTARRPTLSSFRRRPESRTHAYRSNSRPEQACCTSGASSHAALGTGLRRYDGLDGWCLFSAALPVRAGRWCLFAALPA